jgi:hypothetical protein
VKYKLFCVRSVAVLVRQLGAGHGMWGTGSYSWTGIMLMLMLQIRIVLISRVKAQQGDVSLLRLILFFDGF